MDKICLGGYRMDSENSKLFGRKFKCVYGLNEGDTFQVTSDPYIVDRKGTKVVNGINSHHKETTSEIEDLLYSIYWEEI